MVRTIALAAVVGLGCGCSLINPTAEFGDPMDAGADPADAGSVLDATSPLDGDSPGDAASQADASRVPDASPDASGICTEGSRECTSDGTSLRSCEGGEVVVEDCPLGCDPVSVRCRVPVASNLPSGICHDAASAIDLRVNTGDVREIDTTVNCDRVVAQTGGPELCVHVYRDIVVSEGGQVRGVSPPDTNSRALVLVAGRDLIVAGAITARWQPWTGAARDIGRPGVGGVTTGAGVTPALSRQGAGGGSFGSVGGRGGDDTVSGVVGTAPGATYGTNTLVPLVGGSAGGGYGGGAGGGALQLVACRRLTISGILDVNGAGGFGGQNELGFLETVVGGSGGGSGGALLVEAPVVELAGGALLANGGGGGGGWEGTEHGSTETGEAGRRSVEPARGGVGRDSGDGGRGAAGGQAATRGGARAGGGGGAGRIRINSREPVDLSTVVVSPAPTLGGVSAE